MTDTRVEELEALALEEGFRLPMAADLIASLEQHGYVVDLRSGEVCGEVTVALAPSSQALCHLYGMDDADISAIFAPVEEDVVDIDLFDYDGELEDLVEGRLDEEYHAKGQWQR